jgi:HEAT repeat protein
LFETTLTDPDPWSRWRAVRALGGIGVEPSRDAVVALQADPEFRVRFEVANVLRASP